MSLQQQPGRTYLRTPATLMQMTALSILAVIYAASAGTDSDLLASPGVNPDARAYRSVRIRWRPTPGAASYRVEVRGKGRVLIRRKVKGKFARVKLLPGSYHFRLAAIAKSGRQGRWSGWVKLRIKKDSGTPARTPPAYATAAKKKRAPAHPTFRSGKRARVGSRRRPQSAPGKKKTPATKPEPRGKLIKKKRVAVQRVQKEPKRPVRKAPKKSPSQKRKPWGAWSRYVPGLPQIQTDRAPWTGGLVAGTFAASFLAGIRARRDANQLASRSDQDPLYQLFNQPAAYLLARTELGRTTQGGLFLLAGFSRYESARRAYSAQERDVRRAFSLSLLALAWHAYDEFFRPRQKGQTPPARHARATWSFSVSVASPSRTSERPGPQGSVRLMFRF